MWRIAALLSLNLFFFFLLRKMLARNFAVLKLDFKRLESKHNALFDEYRNLEKENSALKESAGEIIALYNITKNICASLDEDKLFDNFRSQISRYVTVSDCRFVKQGQELPEVENCTVLPLNINKNVIGHLITNRIKEEEKDKFYILSQQFLLGIKRALLYKKIQDLAITDSLTKVFSRRYFLERLEEEIARSKKFKYNLSFLMLDIDRFKDYNDRYGHLVGDAILKVVSGVIKEGIRQVDFVGRYGGEEFSVILTETDKKQASFIAERIRRSIENKNISIYDENLKVTISIGISVFPESSSNAITLIDTADKALYEAKAAGRNRVCIYSG